LRSNPFEERGNDGPHGRPNLKDPLQVLDGPITRSRAKKIKEAMQDPNIEDVLERRRTNLIHMIQATDGGGIA
jgi:hypothetical protein